MLVLKLWVEFVTLFVALPVVVRVVPVRLPLLPVLWLATGYCWWVLRGLPGFRREWVWNLSAFGGALGSVLGLFLVLGGVIALAVWRFAPELWLGFVRHRPGLWALVMVAYPVVSVYPQGIVYRAFLMHRYAALFPNAGILVATSALAFGWMHLVFRNRVAVVMTLGGGVIFAWRYLATGSLAVSAVEHALYGCLLFTVGLGRYFFGGTLAHPEALD